MLAKHSPSSQHDVYIEALYACKHTLRGVSRNSITLQTQPAAGFTVHYNATLILHLTWELQTETCCNMNHLQYPVIALVTLAGLCLGAGATS